jgi:hypothetical protein
MQFNQDSWHVTPWRVLVDPSQSLPEQLPHMQEQTQKMSSLCSQRRHPRSLIPAHLELAEVQCHHCLPSPEIRCAVKHAKSQCLVNVHFTAMMIGKHAIKVWIEQVCDLARDQGRPTR